MTTPPKVQSAFVAYTPGVLGGGISAIQFYRQLTSGHFVWAYLLFVIAFVNLVLAAASFYSRRRLQKQLDELDLSRRKLEIYRQTGIQVEPTECVHCGRANGPLARVDADHAGYMCADCDADVRMQRMEWEA